MSTPGIFCLEGEWVQDSLESRLSVRPLLELLEMLKVSSGTIHRDVATRPELEHYLNRWTEDAESSYTVAYLAFHGTPGGIALATEVISLQELAAYLGRGAKGRTLFVGSCATLDAPESELREFCRATGVRGLVGYINEVYWEKSAAFDILVLSELLQSTNLKPMVARLQADHPGFVDGLGLRVATAAWVLP